MISNENITKRFFEAIDYLRDNNIINGTNSITAKYGIDRRNLSKVKNAPSTRSVKLSWLAILVEDYGISAKWLLTGNGNIQ